MKRYKLEVWNGSNVRDTKEFEYDDKDDALDESDNHDHYTLLDRETHKIISWDV